MRRHGETRQLQSIRTARHSLLGLIGALCLIAVDVNGQTVSNENLTRQVEQLTEAMSRTQAQLEQSQREMEQMRNQLAALQKQIGQSSAEDLNSAAAAKLAAQVDEIRERQDVALSQIATHEQSKVETDSKYAVKISGLILLNGFVNTGGVDTPATPTIALPGSGTTGATVRQTILGVDARGPHVLGAQSYGDLHIDFDGGLPSSGYSGAGQSNGRQLRLRTAHAGLRWQHTEAFFSFDHPILNPHTPTSLTAVAVPALSWSGNLWSWNTQLGVTQDIPFSTGRRLRVQAALIDIIDPPPVYDQPSTSSTTPPSPGTAEFSRWPGVETRFALLGANQEDAGLQLGLGGIYAPHRTPGGTRFDTWAATADYRVPLAMRMELTGSAYRGQALGGLGNGGYKDYVYRIDPDYPGQLEYQAVDDMGGWVQLKQKATQRLEFNLAFGMDNVPAGQLRPYAGPYSAYYLNLARNKTYTGNVIFSPSAYFQFSLEYRHLASSPVNGWTTERDIIGVATGYRF
jgi:hypothetical protein